MPPSTLGITMAASYEMHELCTAFPLMKNDQFMALVSDIRENGLLEPIVLYEGKILDGRNRYTACVNAMVEPRFEEYQGTDPLRFVISKNLSRRHLDDSQRAMVAGRLANMRQGARNDLKHSANWPEVSQPEAAEQLNVSERSVRRARQVIDAKVPELVEAVDDGELPVSVAAAIATLPEEIRTQIIASDDRKAAAKQHLAEQKKTQKPADPAERQLKSLHKAWDSADSDARARFLENIGVTSFVGVEL